MSTEGTINLRILLRTGTSKNSKCGTSCIVAWLVHYTPHSQMSVKLILHRLDFHTDQQGCGFLPIAQNGSNLTG